MPALNLGFSGDATMQPAVGSFLLQLNASLFVLDCEYNMDRFNQAEVQNLTLAFIRQLRAAHPATPILLAEGHPSTKAWLFPGNGFNQNATRNGYRQAFNQLLAEGDRQLYYLPGDLKFGAPVDSSFQAQVSAVNGVHPTSLANYRMATYAAGAVAGILNHSAAAPVPLPLLAEIPAPPAPPASLELWTDAYELTVAGLGWNRTRLGPWPYARLPVDAEASVPAAVWNLSRASSGVTVAFTTASPVVALNVSRGVYFTQKEDDIMPFNGRFGVDVYVRRDRNAPWRWAATSASGSTTQSEVLTLSNMVPLQPGETQDYLVYLPTHCDLVALSVGTTASAPAAPLAPASGTAGAAALPPPVLVWGSSIAQGGVVQNAGMTWPSGLQRRLQRPLLNFGFSGNCLMQPAVASVLQELEASMVLVDCLPNMDAEMVNATAEGTFRQLRGAYPASVPLVILEGHTYTNAWLLPAVQQGQQAKRAVQKAIVTKLQQEGLPNIHYVPGDGKLAALGPAMYDATSGVGVHPTNLAHDAIAEYVFQQIKGLVPSV